MPLLVMRSYPGTLLDQSCRMAVRRQVEYGRQQGVPWGISESAFNVVDRHGNYQYKAFGVPGLGLKRGLGDELVVAPYATALAAMVDPEKAAHNFRRLAREGLDGAYGFYEAIDYTHRKARRWRERRRAPTPWHTRGRRPGLPGPSPGDEPGRAGQRRPRRSRWCSASTPILGCRPPRLLLQERAPRHAPITQPRPAEETRVSAPVSAVARPALPVAPHAVPPRAVPVQRHLHHHRHQLGRRGQPLPRPRRHPVSRGLDP